MKFKSLIWGIPVAVGLTILISACESPDPGTGTPDSGSDLPQPVESPAVTPSPASPSPTTPPSTP